MTATTLHHNLNMKPVEDFPINPVGRLKRGNVVRVKGSDVPHNVVQYNWRRGVRVAPFEGPIDSRRRAARKSLDAPDVSPIEWRSHWVKEGDITHIACRAR